MVFIDYYEILEIKPDASIDDIKSSFKKLALKWHPDKNPDMDTTEKMQLLNEAYLMLKNPISRKLYDLEYIKYQSFRNQAFTNEQQAHESGSNSQPKPPSQEFQFSNDDLADWMRKAKSQAIQRAQLALKDLQGMGKAGGRAILEEAYVGIMRYIIIGLLMFFFMRGCQR